MKLLKLKLLLLLFFYPIIFFSPSFGHFLLAYGLHSYYISLHIVCLSNLFSSLTGIILL